MISRRALPPRIPRFAALAVLAVLAAPAAFGEYLEIITPAGEHIFAEVARTPQQRGMGLQHRENLDRDSGMLFVMPHDGEHVFWMKNMRIPLDILFLDAERRITRIGSSVPPPAPGTSDEDLPRVQAPGKYVLELPAGEAGRLGLAEGAVLEFDRDALDAPEAGDARRSKDTATSDGP